MKTTKTDRGFTHIVHPDYPSPEEETTLIAESSAIGVGSYSLEAPGSSFYGSLEHTT